MELVLHDLEEELRQSILARLARMGREVPPGVDLLALSVDSDLVSDSSDSGSDSSESDGPPVHLMKGGTSMATLSVSRWIAIASVTTEKIIFFTAAKISVWGALGARV